MEFSSLTIGRLRCGSGRCGVIKQENVTLQLLSQWWWPMGWQHDVRRGLRQIFTGPDSTVSLLISVSLSLINRNTVLSSCKKFMDRGSGAFLGGVGTIGKVSKEPLLRACDSRRSQSTDTCTEYYSILRIATGGTGGCSLWFTWNSRSSTLITSWALVPLSSSLSRPRNVLKGSRGSLL